MRRDTELLLSLLVMASWLYVGVKIGREIERYMYAERPPDAYGNFPIEPVYRVTWKDGERRT